MGLSKPTLLAIYARELRALGLGVQVLGSWTVGQVSLATETSSALPLGTAAPPHLNGHITVHAFPGAEEPQYRCRVVFSGNTYPLRDIFVSWERTQSGDRVADITSTDASALDELVLLTMIRMILSGCRHAKP